MYVLNKGKHVELINFIYKKHNLIDLHNETPRKVA